MTIHTLFNALWEDYTERLCPSAQSIQSLLRQDTPLINDHIALRTFNVKPLGIAVVAKPFLELGYAQGGEYQFDTKKLRAIHLEHADHTLPKVFISELEVEKCSAKLQSLVARLMLQVDPDHLQGSAFLHAGRLWDLTLATYQTLAQESEYAGWLAAHGHGANHFTVSVNQLADYDEVKQVNRYLRQHQFVMNDTGGEVKGSVEVKLEQSSTMADKVPVIFDGNSEMIPGGFYEFAKRYPMANGDLYNGFVTASADKIFESTHQLQVNES